MPNNQIQSLTISGTTYDIVDNTSGYIIADSPALTGTPTAPIPLSGAGDTQIATVKYVQDAVAGAGAGTVTSVGVANATDGGLSVSGSPITGSGTISVGHSNVLASAQTTSGIYPIKIDKNGHISEYGSAVNIPSKTSDLTNDSGFISSYTETDPVFSASPAAGITSTDISNWNSIVSDDKTWNGVELDKVGTTYGQSSFIPGRTSTSATTAYQIEATTIPNSYRIVKWDNDKYLYATTPSANDNSTKVATTAYVDSAITALPEPMIFKGSLGTGGTITSLPAASSSNEGFTYKVITAGTYASQTAKVGDTFISDGNNWILIPSGDEPSGTVTSVGVSNATDGGLSVSGSPITSSGTVSIGHSNILSSAQTTSGIYPIKIDKNGHISEYGSAVSIPTKVSDLTNDSGFITGMTILSYGSSTWQNFIDAYDANKVVYCRASSNSNPASGSQTRLAFMAYVNNATTPTEVEFQYYRSVSTHTASQQGDQVYVYKLNKTNGWSVTVREASVKVVAGTGLGGTYSNGTMTLTGPTISLNGSSTTSASFYAPTDAGTSGYVLTSSGSGAPTWAEVSTSDTKVTQTVISDSSSNKKGLLLSNGDGSSTLTSTSYTSATLQYQPSTRILSLREYGNSLTPGANLFLSYDTITFAGENFSTDLKQALNPNSHRTIYLPDADGTLALTSDIPTVPTISLNGTSTTSPSFYAPTTAGTSGYVLKSNGSGAPTWSTADVKELTFAMDTTDTKKLNISYS